MSGMTQTWTQQFKAVIDLTRYKEYVIFVVVTTLLGAQVSGQAVDWRLLLVLVANWLSVGFAFMINDVEDAPDDALNPAKIGRNPVSAGTISLRAGYVSSWAVATLATVAFFFLGPIPFWLGIASLATGFLYSWRVIRFKSIPVIDLISHGLLLAGLQFLCGYFTFVSNDNGQWIAPFIFVVSISLYGELFNELRDLEGDLKAGVTHTAALIGERAASILMWLLLIGSAIAFVFAVVTTVIPLWVLAVMAVLGLVTLIRPLLNARRGSIVELTGPLQAPLIFVGALTMIVWVLASVLGL